MATTRKLTTKSGRAFYEIRCHSSRDRGIRSMRWYPPEGWSQKAIDRELAKQAAEFERKFKAGEVLTRAEKAQEAAEMARQAALIQTVRQYGENVFMPAKTVTCSENTRSSFQACLNLFIYPALGELKLHEVKSADISALLLHIQASGKAHATCVKVYSILNLIFKMAYLSEMIDRNPMDKVERPKPRKDEVKDKKVESFTASELSYILDCLNKEPLKWQAYVRLMIDTGIRRAEACGLTWDNVNFAENTISITKTLNYTPQKGVYEDTTKNSKSRVIDVDADIMALLRRLQREQAAIHISRYVFTQDGSAAPMFPQTPERYMQQFGKRYGVEHMHPHKLRHSFASVAITSGADVASVSEILGHSDKAVTLRVYAHADEESRKKASSIFREALKEKHG